MVGQAVTGLQREARPPRAQAPVRLSVRSLSARGDRIALKDVSLAIAAGEILGIAGVSGNGQGLLADVLAGVAVASSGELRIDGEPLGRNARAVVAQGVARIPEDRQAIGTVGDLSVWENVCAEALATHTLSRWGWVRRQAAHAYARAVIAAFDVRGATLERRASALSGGNMQKLVLGRVLQRADGQSPRVIVAHQPTWGLDIGSVTFVHMRLRAARDAGAAVLLISEDLDEIDDARRPHRRDEPRPARAPRGRRPNGRASSSAWRWRARTRSARCGLRRAATPAGAMPCAPPSSPQSP